MKRFNNQPKTNRFNKNFRNRSQKREMHKTKCSECGKDCEVPFKPKEGRPVYCKECYKKKIPAKQF